MNQNNNDDNYGYQEEGDYGQDYYDEQNPGFEAEGEYTEETYSDNQLPVQDQRSFFQRYANLIIFGGVGVFILVMGYVNFGHLLFPKQEATPVTSDQLLNPDYANTQAEVPPPPADMPVIPGAVADGATAPALDAMGVSPAAPVTNPPQPDGGIALSPTAPTSPDDPWAEVANTPTAPATAAPASPSAANVPDTISAAPSGGAAASVGEPVAMPPAEASKMTELQKKLDEAEAARREQEAAIAELQNRLAEAETKAAAPKAEAAPKATSVPVVETAPKPKAVKKPAAPAATKTVTSWELRSASDGVAWITRRGDNQLFRVNVGDEVPGLGRVTAVREQGGQWVITGTEGQIRQ